ncbi:hypothetical protein LD119_00071 [Mesoplasma sp. JKS002660]|uniref:ferritin-like domain-containing protein n=1 Tax=Mesoplasma whartonense TaxID=2878854 RepID=UPI002022A217|nr:ferritin-like domain-containing protein [Mesoplasma sp. JKS002660]MCL8213146.1 hypothetical protein [Mesoplasma sp. JKS002660]
MIHKNTIKEVTDFLNLHISTQLRCMQLSKELNKNGFPGFAWFYQVQSVDEFMHQRRIINYLQGSLGAEDYQLVAPVFEKFAITHPKEALEYYIKMRQETLDFALDFKKKAVERHDYLTGEFYTWFIKDYWTEIDENNDILDRVKMNGDVLAGLDRRMNKRAEIDPENVIHPMKIFLAD